MAVARIPIRSVRKAPDLTIRLYDLALADDRRMSPYCNRVKMALALKRIPYETVPVGFTDIPGILGGGVTKIVPLIEDGERRVADSFAIAEYLDERYPGPALFASGAAGRIAARFVEAYCFTVVHAQAMPLVALSIHDRIREADKAYFRSSREARLGMSLEDAFADHETRLPGYRKVFAPLRQTLQHAPFLGGDAPLYVDAIVYGTVTWLNWVSDLDWFGGDEVLAGWYARCHAIVAPTEA